MVSVLGVVVLVRMVVCKVLVWVVCLVMNLLCVRVVMLVRVLNWKGMVSVFFLVMWILGFLDRNLVVRFWEILFRLLMFLFRMLVVFYLGCRV